jgi:hypothetical protein
MKKEPYKVVCVIDHYMKFMGRHVIGVEKRDEILEIVKQWLLEFGRFEGERLTIENFNSREVPVERSVDFSHHVTLLENEKNLLKKNALHWRYWPKTRPTVTKWYLVEEVDEHDDHSVKRSFDDRLGMEWFDVDNGWLTDGLQVFRWADVPDDQKEN